jgi:hypothetical protein
MMERQPRLFGLVTKAAANRARIEESVGKARADAIDIEEVLINQIRDTVRKSVDKQVKVTATETAKLEQQLIDEIREAIAASVADIDMKPLLRDTVEPGFARVMEEVKKSAFVDRSAAMQKAVEGMADRVVAAVQKSVASIPKQDLSGMLKEVRAAVAAIEFPKLMTVTAWDLKVVRDAHGRLDSVRAEADEWVEQ